MIAHSWHRAGVASVIARGGFYQFAYASKRQPLPGHRDPSMGEAVARRAKQGDVLDAGARLAGHMQRQQMMTLERGQAQVFIEMTSRPAASIASQGAFLGVIPPKKNGLQR